MIDPHPRRADMPPSQPPVKPLRRRIPWFKLAVLGGLVWFASTRLDFNDRLVVSAAAGSGPVEIPLLRSADQSKTLSAGEQLPVERVEENGEIVELWALTPTGRVQIDPDQVGPETQLEVQPGLFRSLRGVSLQGLLVALAVHAPVPLVLAWRWHLLLRAVGLSIGFWSSVRLTWIGLFFNTVMPGGAGGDLVKLVEVGRYTDRRSTVLSTIALDRIVGLLVLIALGVTAALMVGGASTGIVTTALIVAGSIAIGFTLYTSSLLRRWIDVRALLSRLPMREELVRLDDAVVAMSKAPLALLGAAALSLLAQAIVIATAFLAARSMGLAAVTPIVMAEVVPIASMANAVPLSPGGLGQLEVAFQELMHARGVASLAEGFMVGVLLRLISVLWSLPGLPIWMTTVETPSTSSK